jgi:hypothetical protein
MFVLTLSDELTRDLWIPESHKEPAQLPVAGVAEEHRPYGVYPGTIPHPAATQPTYPPPGVPLPIYPSERERPYGQTQIPPPTTQPPH